MESPLEQQSDHVLTPPHRSFVEISLPQLASNYHSIAGTLRPGATMMPVVKANAYGHGVLPVARTLVACGAKWLAVSNTDEGVELRQSGVATSVRIVVMAGILPYEWEAIVANALTPVLHTLQDAEHLDEIAAAKGDTIPFHFKIDTGLARLGSTDSLESIAARLAKLRHAKAEGLMTHFASASDLHSNQAEEQVERFCAAFRTLRSYGLALPWLHMDSTNSLNYPRHDETFQLVRPGLSLYGYTTPALASSPKAGNLDVKPVLSWKARILHLKDVPAGTAVGYGGLHTTTRPTRAAVLGLGYADGYPHQLSSIGHVLINGRIAPILGSVSMDLTSVDVTDIPGLTVGDAVTLIGNSGDRSIDASDLARMARTIPYAILTNIHTRVKRVYPA
jgi:alanine racemase